MLYVYAYSQGTHARTQGAAVDKGVIVLRDIFSKSFCTTRACNYIKLRTKDYRYVCSRKLL